MKRLIRSSKQFRSLDPYEIKKLSYTFLDSGYVHNKEQFDKLKNEITSKYGPESKVTRRASDTPGLIMYDIYIREN